MGVETLEQKADRIRRSLRAILKTTDDPIRKQGVLVVIGLCDQGQIDRAENILQKTLQAR